MGRKGQEMIKVLMVFGTRPEAIKMCPLVIECRKREDIKCVVCLTGQHREMLHQAMEIFRVTADYDLDIMQPGQSLSTVMVNVIKGLDDVLREEQPDIVLVHGDTTTSFAAAIAAFHRMIPVGHVEAGLRTYDMASPFPEEFNRQGVDMISSVYFSPTDAARENLLKEGKKKENIFVTGNTVIDALKFTVSPAYRDECLEWARGSRMILLTTHRRENLGKPMENIFKALCKVTEKYKDVKVIFPVHKNPRVREIADRYLKGMDRIRMIEPLDARAFHNYMARSHLILTDSGGIQEEAPSLGVPVLVLRNVTERPEGLKTGALRLIGTEEEMVYKSVIRLLESDEEYQKMRHFVNPYGDGNAAVRIVDIITKQKWRS